MPSCGAKRYSFARLPSCREGTYFLHVNITVPRGSYFPSLFR